VAGAALGRAAEVRSGAKKEALSLYVKKYPALEDLFLVHGWILIS
jgi:hypothetical protein